MASETPFVVPPDGVSGPMGAQDGAADIGPAALRSQATPSFARVLEHAGVTVALTAPLTGIVAFLRRNGDLVNTHTRPFDRPMGIARYKESLALGTATQVWGFANYPSATVDDRCHLTGLAMVDSHPECVTVLSPADSTQGSRGQTEPRGASIDVEIGASSERGVWAVDDEWTALAPNAD
jgi:hypothetical protein